MMIAVGFMVHKEGMPPSAGPQPFPPSLMPAFMFGMSVLFAAFAVWFILTLIGLVRLRFWARYSLLVIAGLMAALGGISMVTSFAMPFLMPALSATPNQSAADPGIMRIIFFVTGAFYGLVAALGVALLVYFNLARTRALFLLSAPVSVGPPNTSTGRARPTSITVISWMYMICGPLCCLYVFVPFPAFILGFILYGFAAHCMYALIGIITFVIGYGLFRLREAARLGVYALFALCPVQTVVLLTPWGARQFRLCMDAINAATYAGRQPPPNVFASPGVIVFFMLLTTALYGIVLWLLHRHRVAFTPAPSPPSLPSYSEPIEGLTP